MAESGSSLANFQQQFAGFLLAADSQPQEELQPWLAKAEDGETVAGRTAAGLRVYRNNVIYSLMQALAAQFPVLHKLVGAEFFGALTRDYIRRYPPVDPVLGFYGDRMASFITTVPACQSLPYLADMATLELYCQHALHAADDPVLSLDQLAGIDAQHLGDASFSLHASVSLFSSEFPLYRIWAANVDESDAEIRLAQGHEDYLLIYRRELQVQVVTLQPPAFKLLQQLQLGMTLEQAWGFADEAREADITELSALLVYLLGLEVFSQFNLEEEPA